MFQLVVIKATLSTGAWIITDIIVFVHLRRANDDDDDDCTGNSTQSTWTLISQ